jgi:alanine racemase
MNEHNHTQIILNRDAALHNIEQLSRTTSAQVCAVVKSNAYGHGLTEMVKILQKSGHVSWWAVNSLDEAMVIRHYDMQRPILIMGAMPRARYHEAVQAQCSVVISSHEEIAYIEKLKFDTPLRIHLKVNTGMNRLGFAPDEIIEVLNRINKTPQIKLEGAMSHLANAEDVLTQEYALQQVNTFNEVKSQIERAVEGKVIFHMCATAATLLLPEAHHDMVRFGIGLYGLWPSYETKLSYLQKYGHELDLQPVLQFKTQIVSINNIKNGSFIGYGCTYQVTRDSIVATIPVGYYEGLPRYLSNQGSVLINGSRCRILGRVCMNMTMVDVTDLESVKVGDSVVLIGQDSDKGISAEDIAQYGNTINYEVVTQLNSTIQKFIK